jgi:hypothetical protein
LCPVPLTFEIVNRKDFIKQKVLSALFQYKSKKPLYQEDNLNYLPNNMLGTTRDIHGKKLVNINMIHINKRYGVKGLMTADRGTFEMLQAT